MARKLPFTYFGSQYRSFPFIRDRLPKRDYYIEPFGGSAVVLTNLEETKFEVYNDANEMLVDFFYALRNDTDELLAKLRLTPFHRREFEEAVALKDAGLNEFGIVERARIFFVLAQQGRYSRSIENKTPGEWKRAISQIRGGNASKPNEYRNKIEQLAEIAERFGNVQIECRDALKVIEEYDHEDAVFYVDPPYVPEVRENSKGAYGKFDWNVSQHEELANVLQSCDGYVALSGYTSDIYRELYPDWQLHLDEAKTNQNGSTGDASDNSETQEALWTNYDANELGRGME